VHAAKIGIAETDRLEVEWRRQDRGLDATGMQCRETRAGGACVDEVEILGGEAVWLGHGLEIDQRDVLGTADHDLFPLEIGDRLYLLARKQLVGRLRHLVPDDLDGRALVDRTNEVGEASFADVESAGRQLLCRPSLRARQIRSGRRPLLWALRYLKLTVNYVMEPRVMGMVSQVSHLNQSLRIWQFCRRWWVMTFCSGASMKAGLALPWWRGMVF